MSWAVILDTLQAVLLFGVLWFGSVLLDIRALNSKWKSEYKPFGEE